MSDQEFAWWSNPFLRMLSSPLRMCLLTRRYAPADHLIRITATLLPQPDVPISSSTPAYITPSNLHHSRFAQQPDGMGSYITCSKMAIPLLLGKGRHRGMFPGAEVHGLIEEQMENGLQIRCIEEAQLLGIRLRGTIRYAPGELAAFTIRRLTITECEIASKESVLHDSKAMAIIVAPKDDKVPETSVETSLHTQFLLRNPTSLTPTGSSSDTVLAPPHIPVFRIASMFKSAEHRVKLRKLLDLALSAERNALRATRSQAQKNSLPPYEPKTHDTYVLCASRRVDAVPLTTALWRLRLWQGNNNG